MTQRYCLLVCEGFTNSTQIVRRLLAHIFSTVEVVEIQQLLGRSLRDTHLIFLRVCHPQWRWLVDYLVERQLSYDYVIDDNFYEISIASDPHNGPLYDHPATHDCLTDFITHAKNTIVFSRPFELELNKRVPEARVAYVPPPVDLDLFKRSRPLGAARDSGTLRIGYATTPRAWLCQFLTEVVQQTVTRLGEAVEFDIVGWWPPSLASHPRVNTFEAIWDYEAYVEFVATRSWNLGIAPLGDSVFENCKTNNKFREFSASGVPAIYSDVPLYRSCVEHSVTGWLEPNDPDRWAQRIASIAADRAACTQIADAAFQRVALENAHPVAARELALALGLHTERA